MYRPPAPSRYRYLRGVRVWDGLGDTETNRGQGTAFGVWVSVDIACVYSTCR
jgi:hypothetical protein